MSCSSLRPSFCDLDRAETPHRQLYVKWGYPILKCLCCGLVKTEIAGTERGGLMPDPDPGWFAGLYGEEFFEGGQADSYAC